MKVRRKLLIPLGIVLVVLLVAFMIVDTFYFPMLNGTVDSGNVAIVDVKVSDKEITLSMNQCTSVCFASRIQPKYKEGTLYIKYKGGVFTGGLAGLSEPTIITIPNKYGNIIAVSELDLNGVTPIWLKDYGMVNITSKEQYDKLKKNLLGDYHIEELTYISPYSSLSLDYAQNMYIAKPVSIKEDKLIFGDDVKTSNTKFVVSEMTESDWKEYHDKYDFEVGECKNLTKFDEKLTYYKADIGDYQLIFSEKEVYMLSNPMIFKLVKDK